MSRVVATLTLADGMRVIELTKNEPGYGASYGYSISTHLEDRAQACTGFASMGDALNAALDRIGATV